jgi:hypothetical protein
MYIITLCIHSKIIKGIEMEKINSNGWQYIQPRQHELLIWQTSNSKDRIKWKIKNTTLSEHFENQIEKSYKDVKSNIQIHDWLLSGLGTGTSIKKVAGLNLLHVPPLFVNWCSFMLYWSFSNMIYCVLILITY